MLQKLKTQHEELIFLTGTKIKMIEEELGQELPAYSKLLTSDVDVIDWNSNYLKPLSEERQCKAYQLRIDALKSKLSHSESFLSAVVNGDSVKEFDLFNEIKFSEAEICECDNPVLGDNIWSCGNCKNPFKKVDKQT